MMIFFSQWLAKFKKKISLLPGDSRPQNVKSEPDLGEDLNASLDEKPYVQDSRSAVLKLLMGDAKTLDESLKRGMEDLKRLRQADVQPLRTWSDGKVTMTELYPEIIYKDDTPQVRAEKLQRRKEVDEHHKAMGLKRIRG